jgi:hypothetical protein
LRDNRQLIPFAIAAILLLLIAGAMSLKGKKRLGGFFFLVGVSFMVVELYIINMLRSAINGYVETSSLALGIFTLGSAAGALCASRVSSRVSLIALAPVFLLLGGILSFFPFGAPLVIKLLLIVLAIFPTAFITGTFFPKGFFITPAGSGPWYYAIDTVASAGAFLLFYFITSLWGFSATGLTALAGYAAAAAILAFSVETKWGSGN